MTNIQPAKKGTAIKFTLDISQMSKYSEIEKEYNDNGYNVSRYKDIFGFTVFGVFLAVPK